jgi:hypothetical protein
MRPKRSKVRSPKAIKAIALGLIHQPISITLSNTQPSDSASQGFARKAWRHNCGTYLEWITYVPANVIRQLGKIGRFIHSGADKYIGCI